MAFLFIRSFEISLLTGDSEYDDIAFHISPRMGKSVVLNSFINGSWETEEHVSNNPFNKRESFHLLFVINSESYKVYIFFKAIADNLTFRIGSYIKMFLCFYRSMSTVRTLVHLNIEFLLRRFLHLAFVVILPLTTLVLWK